VRHRALLTALAIALFPVFPVAASAATPGVCAPRILVLSAFPAEMSRIIAASTLGPEVHAAGRTFYPGRLEGKNVVMALTGIGPVNARTTTDLAFRQFRCGFSGVVFSGVAGAGGRSAIGDVTVPARWTLDNGRTWVRSTPAMLAVAGKVAPGVRLERTTPLGDPACVCGNPDAVPTVTLKHVPGVLVGGDGSTTDPFGGRAVPCIPGGGDLEGCAPCPVALHQPPDAAAFVDGMVPLLAPGFATALIAPSPAPSESFEANDEETAAVATVATAHHTRFVGFRGISDGSPDPLMLPGFPSQFFVYKQIAADNSASMALAFLKAWRP
jgi:nucleoside phosphorylase